MNSAPFPSTPAAGGDFDWTAPSGAYAQPAPAAASPEAGNTERKRGRLTGAKTRLAAMVAAGAIIGGGVALAVEHSSGSSATASSTGISGVGGGGFVPGSGSAGMGGITPTAYRLSGTITAVSGSTVTIKATSGTKTYTVTSSTHLMRSGSSASLSSFQVGDSVVGSTTTSGGSALNDLVYGMVGGGGRIGTASS